MTELSNLQDQFQCFIRSGESEISDAIVPTESVSVATRLGIYRDAYKLRLIESLTTSFPALHSYLGTEEFQKLCCAYIDNHPSSYRSIRWYGDALSAYVKKYYDKPYSYLSELADFEWNMTLAFDAADDAVLRVEDMANVAPESWADLQFTLHSSVMRLNYSWNTIPIWQALINDHELPQWNKSAHPVPWVLWRSPDYMIQFYSLSEAEAWALDAIIQGGSFGALCDGLCQWIPMEEVGMRAASYLKNWIQSGFLSQLNNSE